MKEITGDAALIADVVVNPRTGVVRPIKFTIAIDCGPIANPDGLHNQVEGGLLQGMSRSLVEEVTWNTKCVTSVDWTGYTSLRLDYEVPAIETVFVVPDNVSATGAGENSITELRRPLAMRSSTQRECVCVTYLLLRRACSPRSIALTRAQHEARFRIVRGACFFSIAFRGLGTLGGRLPLCAACPATNLRH